MTITHDNDLIVIEDQIVLSVLAKFATRSAKGLRKYGTTLDREDLTIYDWINHLQEELMDATLYLERIRKEISLEKTKSTRKSNVSV